MLVRLEKEEAHSDPYSLVKSLNPSLDPVTLGRMDDVMRVVRIVLSNEYDRAADQAISYIGTDIFVSGSRLYYGTAGTERMFVDFALPELAKQFYNVVVGILMLGLTKFDASSEYINMKTEKVNETNPLPIGDWKADRVYAPRPYMKND